MDLSFTLAVCHQNHGYYWRLIQSYIVRITKLYTNRITCNGSVRYAKFVNVAIGTVMTVVQQTSRTTSRRYKAYNSVTLCTIVIEWKA